PLGGGGKFWAGDGGTGESEVLGQRGTVPRRLPSFGGLVHRHPNALEGFLDRSRLPGGGEQRRRVRAVGTVAVFGFGARRGRKRQEGAGRADFGIDERQPM